VHVARRGEDRPAHGSAGANRFDHIPNSGGVGVVVGQRLPIEVHAGGEMDHMLGAEIADRGCECGGVADIPFEKQILMAGVARLVAVEIQNFPMVFEKAVDQICADETRSAGDQHSCHVYPFAIPFACSESLSS
jgi:hypothetical protein